MSETALVRVTLPFPPSVNALYRAAPGRGMVRTKAADEYHREVALAFVGRTPLFGAVAIHRLALHPRRSSSDIDGPFKALFDALNGRAWLDDNQVKAIDGVRMYGPTPLARVEIDLQGERFCTPAEVRAHAEAKAEANRKRKATLAENRRKKAVQFQLATSASYPARRP